MKKGLKFTKEQLEKLYLKNKLSLSQIGKKFKCHNTNILYWLKKFNIKRGPAYRKKIHIPKDILENLYINKRLSSLEIAERLGNINHRTVRKKLKKAGIKTRPLSESLTKKFKAPFSGNLEEKAFLLGLRAGDYHGKRKNLSPRIQTTTTHLAQIELTKKAFEKYGETKVYLSKNKGRGDEWFVYVDLHPSFGFLLEKQEEIPGWVLKDDNIFFNFLAAYMDCEGNWHLSKSQDIHARFTFRIRTGDRKILEDIKNRLGKMNYRYVFSLEKGKGPYGLYAPFRREMYNLTLNRKKDVLRLIEKLLPLSKHSEKIRKMDLMLENKNKLYKHISDDWTKLREKIKKEILKNISNKQGKEN